MKRVIYVSEWAHRDAAVLAAKHGVTIGEIADSAIAELRDNIAKADHFPAHANLQHDHAKADDEETARV